MAKFQEQIEYLVYLRDTKQIDTTEMYNRIRTLWDMAWEKGWLR